MKKSIFKIFFLQAVFVFLFTNCQAQSKEKRAIGEFHTLKVSGLAVVHLSQVESQQAQVEVSGMPIADLITELKDGVLTVTTQGQHSGESINVQVSSSKLKKIEVSGAAQLYTREAIKGDKLSITVMKSAAADLEVDVNLLAVRMEDNADLSLRGKTEEQYIVSAGSRGSLDNSELQAGPGPQTSLNNSKLEVRKKENSLSLKSILYLFE
jgi:uncharacterized protein with FMN-binding domain